MDGYTVIDVDTTGLSPSNHDRVVELAIVYVSDEEVIRVPDIHCEYLAALAEVALADGDVTAERADRDLVARLLGLPSSDVDAALQPARSVDVCLGGGGSPASTSVQLEPGDRIALTGDMTLDRKDWEARVRGAGLIPGGVTKGTKLLVASDLNTPSGKGSKARAYGVPIIDEDEFARLLENYLARYGDDPGSSPSAGSAVDVMAFA